MRMYKLSSLVFSFLAIVYFASAQPSQERMSHSAPGMQGAHVMITPDQIKWGPAPPALPPGCQVAVLDGDPSKAGGVFVIRAKFPDGYKVPPHWHPTEERVLVLAGTLGVGMGDKFDPASGKELPVGSYAVVPKEARHFAWAKGDTVIQISGIGPFEVNYVNAADDPRKASKN